MSTALKRKLGLAQWGIYENVEYELKDKDGKVKKLFQQNLLCTHLLKKGLISPRWINSPFASLVSPFLGHYASKMTVKNLITNAGFAGAASRLGGSGAEAIFNYIAVGTGIVAASAANTTLGTETAASGLSRVAGTVSRITTTQTNDTSQVTTTFTVTGTVAVTESGLLNAASVGVLLCRQVFTAINVVNGDSLAITWQIKCA